VLSEIEKGGERGKKGGCLTQPRPERFGVTGPSWRRLCPVETASLRKGEGGGEFVVWGKGSTLRAGSCLGKVSWAGKEGREHKRERETFGAIDKQWCWTSLSFPCEGEKSTPAAFQGKKVGKTDAGRLHTLGGLLFCEEGEGEGGRLACEKRGTHTTKFWNRASPPSQLDEKRCYVILEEGKPYKKPESRTEQSIKEKRELTAYKKERENVCGRGDKRTVELQEAVSEETLQVIRTGRGGESLLSGPYGAWRKTGGVDTASSGAKTR